MNLYFYGVSAIGNEIKNIMCYKNTVFRTTIHIVFYAIYEIRTIINIVHTKSNCNANINIMPYF